MHPISPSASGPDRGIAQLQATAS